MANENKVSSTECVHAGARPCETSSSVATPLVRSAPFKFESTNALIGYLEGRTSRRQAEYGRMGNPTVAHTQDRLAALEGAEAAQLFASGMAAVTTLMLAVLQSGDHIVLTSDAYKRTRDFGSEFLAKFGVRASVVPPSVEEIEQAVEPSTRMVFTEMPTNPYLHVLDVERLGDLGRGRGVLTVVDSTFATPVNLRPLDLGVDLVLHSATKYLGGHNDLIAGVLAGKEGTLAPVSELLMTLGGICAPDTAWLLDRGLKTLGLRVARQNETGQAVAEFLEAHGRVRQVFYPGLPSHTQHELAARQMPGFGGVVSFLVDADFEGTARFVDALRIPVIAPSLGGTECLVEQAVIMGYWDLSEAQRQAYGMKDNLVRLSVGVEDAEDIVRDLDQALNEL